MENTVETTQGDQKKRLVRNFLLDSRFQLRWAFRAVLAITLIVAVMGFFLYRTVSDASDQLITQKAGEPGLTNEAFEEFQAQAAEDKTVTLGILIGGLVSLVLLIGGLTIIYTHKIAGPVYKIRKLLNSIDGNNLQLWAKLRRDDELQQVFVDIDSMLRRIRQQRRKDIEVLEGAREECGDTEKASQLNQLIDTYNKSIEMK